MGKIEREHSGSSVLVKCRLIQVLSLRTAMHLFAPRIQAFLLITLGTIPSAYI